MDYPDIQYTPTQFEFMVSAKYWRQRCARQLAYIHEIEQSDRRVARKVELQLSALAVYRRCLEHLDELKRTKVALEEIDRRIGASLKESRDERRKARK